MKKIRIRISLPFSEVCHKLNYELHWGTLKTEVLYHDLLDPDTDLFLLDNNRILHIKKQGQDTLLTVIEPQSSTLSLKISELFHQHL